MAGRERAADRPCGSEPGSAGCSPGRVFSARPAGPERALEAAASALLQQRTRVSTWCAQSRAGVPRKRGCVWAEAGRESTSPRDQH